MPYIRKIYVLIRKDILIELRTKQHLTTMFFFAALVIIMFNFAMGTESDVVERSLPGYLWLVFLFAGVLALGRSFTSEMENECLEGLLICLDDREIIYVAKLAVNITLLFLVEILLLPLFIVFYNLEIWGLLPQVVLLIFLGTVGLAAVGTLYAALTANIRAREALLPVLLFPIVVPVLIASVKVLEVVFQGGSLGDAVGWIKLLVAFDIVFAVAGTLACPYILER